MPFSGGTGISTDPYIVATTADMILINDYPDKCFLQTEDIDLFGCDNWVGIGREVEGQEFTGTYDGGSHNITGMVTTDTSATEKGGLFGYVLGATIKNVRLQSPDATFETDGYTGLFVSQAYDSTIENCHVIKGTLVQNKAGSSGGFIGESGYNIIADCSVTASITTTNVFDDGTFPYMGGFAAKVYGAIGECSLAHCSAEVDMVSTDEGGEGMRSGGFIGVLEGGFDIQECWALGSATSISTIPSAGGFIGWMRKGEEAEETGRGRIKNCYTQVAINQNGGVDIESVAMFIGIIESEADYPYIIEKCYSASVITIVAEEEE